VGIVGRVGLHCATLTSGTRARSREKIHVEVRWVYSIPHKVAQAVRGGAGRKVEHGGDRRLDRWCWTLWAGGSDRPMSCNKQGSVQMWKSIDSGWWLLFDRGRSDVMARFDGAARRRRG
jgi:hypothetical protein